MKKSQLSEYLYFILNKSFKFTTVFRSSILLGLLISSNLSLNAQSIIPIFNGSFEKDRHKASQTPFGWYPYGDPKTSSPDIHSRYYTYFDVTQLPSDGDRFLSMVTRNDWSTEGICQFIETPMLTNGKYRLMMDLSTSNDFQSRLKNDTLAKFTNPARLEIWGYNRSQELDSLLAVTATLNHTDWKTYSLILTVPMQINDVCIVVSYPEGTVSPKPGNVLIDNIQNLEEIYAHPALPTDPNLLQEKSLEDLANIIEKLEPELISFSETSSMLKVFLSVPAVEKALKMQTVQNYIYNSERIDIIQHIKIMDAIGAKKLADIVRRAFRSYIYPEQATQEDVDFFSSVDAIYQQASTEKSLLKSKLQFLEAHKESFLEEIKTQLY